MKTSATSEMLYSGNQPDNLYESESMDDSLTSDATEQDGKRKCRLIVLFVFVVVAALIAGGIWLISGVNRTSDPNNKAQSVVTSSKENSTEDTGTASGSPDNASASQKADNAAGAAGQNTTTPSAATNGSTSGQNANASPSASSGSKSTSGASGSSGSSSGKVWVPPTTKVIHHEAQYRTVNHPAEYDTVEVILCSCGLEFSSNEAWSAHNKSLGFGNGHSYSVVDKQVLKKAAWTERILVSDAWDETLTTPGYWK